VPSKPMVYRHDISDVAAPGENKCHQYHPVIPLQSDFVSQSCVQTDTRTCSSSFRSPYPKPSFGDRSRRKAQDNKDGRQQYQSDTGSQNPFALVRKHIISRFHINLRRRRYMRSRRHDVCGRSWTEGCAVLLWRYTAATTTTTTM